MEVGFNVTAITVPEAQATQSVCVELLSGTPSEAVTAIVLSLDDTATGMQMNGHLLYVRCLSVHLWNGSHCC